MLSSIPDILDELRAGRMIVLVDDEGRENEGDLVLAGEMVTPSAINFMLSTARGYLCLSLTEADADRLELHPQAAVNTSVRTTAFTVSIDGSPRHGITTGVSAGERARTIRLAIDSASGPADFVRPGHINPLRARDGGVLVRAGQTEGSVDLCRLAGLRPSAVIIEIMREDGEMARVHDLEKLCERHTLKMCSVAQIIEYRLARETLVSRLAPLEGAMIQTDAGPFMLYAFESVVDPFQHLALTLGGVGALDESGRVIPGHEPTLVRMHRRNLLGDVFGDPATSPEGSTREALFASMRQIRAAGRGAVVYLRTEGVGDDFHARLQRIRHRDHADPDRPDLSASDESAPHREFGVGGQILRELGLRRLRLLTNHPKPRPGLESFGLEVVEHVPIEIGNDPRRRRAGEARHSATPQPVSSIEHGSNT